MKKAEKTYLQSDKYRCPLCRQMVAHSDYLFLRKRAADGAWTLVECCRRCKELAEAKPPGG